jgi:RimJ/RimL family protein N-acetyltransferase
MHSLETKRLLLRPLQLADAEQIQILFSQWEIVRYLTALVPWPFPADAAYKYIRDKTLPAIERGEEWHWSLFLKTAPEQLIGCVGLHAKDDDNRGYWIGLPWQRQGLMSEACDAVTDYWFNVLKFAVLRVPKAAANIASKRISEKQGMRLVATVEHDYVCGRLPAEIWEITAEEWRSRKKERADS